MNNIFSINFERLQGITYIACVLVKNNKKEIKIKYSPTRNKKFFSWNQKNKNDKHKSKKSPLTAQFFQNDKPMQHSYMI